MWSGLDDSYMDTQCGTVVQMKNLGGRFLGVQVLTLILALCLALDKSQLYFLTYKMELRGTWGGSVG